MRLLIWFGFIKDGVKLKTPYHIFPPLTNVRAYLDSILKNYCLINNPEKLTKESHNEHDCPNDDQDDRGVEVGIAEEVQVLKKIQKLNLGSKNHASIH